MLLSIALILLIGMASGWICKKIKLPALLGMIATGMILGPYVCDFIDPKILNISPELRKIALIIILMRAGLSLNVKDLKKVGRPAILMCFLPATFEIIGMILAAPVFLHVTVLEAAIIGSVVAAVSPAVIVPKMLKLMDEGYGTASSIPQMILAGASVDDVFVIVIFTAFTGLARGNKVSVLSFAQVPVSIFTGMILGYIIGFVLAIFFKKIHIRDSSKVIIMLSVAFIFVTLEDRLPDQIPFSGLIAVMAAGIALNQKREVVADRLSAKFSRLWVASEIILFVLVGATVDIKYALKAGIAVVVVITLSLMVRMIGVFCCLLGTKLRKRERLFCMIAYTPKATVQAAIGGIPLTLGLSCGNIVLTVAVIAILMTAPLGAFFIDLTYKKLLDKE